jgi:spore coat protein CotH
VAGWYITWKKRTALAPSKKWNTGSTASRSKIRPYEVVSKIDNNIAKLGRDDAKFFLVNISPSQKEIAFLKKQYGEDGAKEQMKEFAVRCDGRLCKEL